MGEILELNSVIKISALATIRYDAGFLRYSNIACKFLYTLRMKRISNFFYEKKPDLLCFTLKKIIYSASKAYH